MHRLTLISGYKHLAPYRLSFNGLAGRVFGIDFERWYQLGFWNDRYDCYSYADGDRVVANVSASRVELLLQGERKRAVQIGTVMTHPDYRNLGLSAELMRTVMDRYAGQCELFYLFANESVLDFYPKFGFRSVRESRFAMRVSGIRTNPDGVRRLNTASTADLSLIATLAEKRRPISGVCAVDRAQSIFMWHCLNVFTDDLYYLEKENVLVIAKTERHILHLFDIVSRDPVRLHPILERIATPEIREAIFYFTPDCLDADTAAAAIAVEATQDDVLFVKPAFPVDRAFVYPLTAKA